MNNVSTRVWLYIVTLALAVVAVGWTSPAGAQQAAAPAVKKAAAPAVKKPVAPAAKKPAAVVKKPATSDSIVLNFEGVDIREVIFSIAAALKINYWIDPQVQGQVTVTTYDRISREDLFPVFHQILRSNGYAAIKEGDLYMIVPAEAGKTRAPAPADGDQGDSTEGGFVIELVTVEHVSAEEVVTLLDPFVSPGGDVVAYPRSNLIIITETRANARRLGQLVKTFDNDTFADLNAKIYRIEHASLEDISRELWTILESYQIIESGARLHMIPLARLNSLAIIAFDPAIFANIEYWLDILDVEAEGGTRRQVYVYHVENSKAADLSQVLNDLYSGEAEGPSGSRRGRSGTLSESGVGLAGGLSNVRSAASGRGQQKSSGSSKGRGGKAAASDSLADGALFEHEIKIVPDETTNSLVILATPRDYGMIRNVLKELDVVPRQVLIEVLIAEITLDEETQFGITQELLANSSSSSSASVQDSGGTFLDVFGREVRLTGGAPNADSGFGGFLGVFSHYRSGAEIYRGVIKALSVRSRLKVLSRPHIMTTDNKEASIIIGQEVPIITSQADTNVSTGGQTRFLQNVQYRDTGIILKVKPQVNSEGLVNMEISQEVSGIIGTTTGNISSPTFSKRETKTTVVVQGGQTIIIGGIIGETKRKGRRGIPYLMDLPIFGVLFRSESDEIDRTELIILITPYVVRDHAEARSVTERFRHRVGDVLRELQEDGHGVQEGHTLIIEQSSP
ncbi:MAG: type II secretion system secretin GspD [Deltaproteobacteria bacterium]